MFNILLLSNELRYTCGVTNHLLHLTRGLAGTKDTRLWIICGGGNGTGRFDDIEAEVICDKRFLHSERNIKNYTSAIAYVTKFILKNKIQIVHSHSHYAANIAGNSSRITGTAAVQTNHGLLTNPGSLKHFNADRYIAVNEHIYRYLVKNKIADNSKVSLIRCGIPVPEKLSIKDNSRIKVIAASRFTDDKGIDVYINAVSKLDNDIKKRADFFLAGEGEKKADLLALNKETGANISYLGNVKDIYRILRSCHILVYTSSSDSEGFPAIITEAGANGLLIISSGFKGIEHVIQHNKDGLIFRTGDTYDLRNKLEKAVNNYRYYKQIAEGFYCKVKDWYSIDKMINKHMELYKQCLH